MRLRSALTVISAPAGLGKTTFPAANRRARPADRQLVDALTGQDAGSGQAVRHSSALVEPLSERELEVLDLIAGGLTNREIASRLFLPLNTVKAHTRNVYAKLGVHSRTQVAARARTLGLLSSN